MSWKYLPRRLITTGVVGFQDLNRGFLSFVNEVQGRLNEHNWKEGAVREEAVPTPGAGDLNFVSTDVLDLDAAYEFESTRNTLTGASYAANITWGGWRQAQWNYPFGWAGAWLIPNTLQWDIIGSETNPFITSLPSAPGDTINPCERSFTLTETTVVLIALSLQGYQSFNTMGAMSQIQGGCSFALEVNGAVITESLYGTADSSNDPVAIENFAPYQPMAERMHAAPAYDPNGVYGYSVCVETVMTLPPGHVTVRGLVKKLTTDGGDAIIGSRELIILKLMR
jgi:hypothetical protein